ncbi:xylose isomerase, partial [Acinetobacter baumannii]|nr:xylose isomerase [Acinetobacter baumannii]
NNFARMVEVLAEKQQQSGVKLLWGTANCFTNPRYGAGAATNPDPEVFSWAATQVVTAMNATHQLGGENYVLWGGREGYETLLNTDLRQEREQIGRFMQLVVEHKHKIGFKGTLLIEPKPQEPTKHQYDYDASTVYGFLKQFGLEKEIKLNIE